MTDKKERPGNPKRKGRTSTGCITCRIRRVKCDETRPSCNRCTQSRRQCDGYLPGAAHQGSSLTGEGAASSSLHARRPVSRRALAAAVRQLGIVGPASRVLAAGPEVPGGAVSCFDFFRFRVRAVASTPGHGPLGDAHGFWDRTLLQTAHVERAAWHAVAALGALQRRWELVSRLTQHPPHRATFPARGNQTRSLVGDGTSDARGSNASVSETEASSVQLAGQANTSYVQALKMASSITDINAILVLSIALAATANLAGKWSDSQIHIRAATRLVGQVAGQAGGRPVSQLGINDAADSLARLDLQWLTFQDSQAPYPYTESHLVAHALRRVPEINSLGCAQDVLMGMMRRLWIGARLASSDQPGPGHEGVSIAADLAEWEQKTLQFLIRTPRPAGKASPGLCLLKICHAAVRLCILARVTKHDYNELAWDHHLGYFERITALSALFIKGEVYKNPLLPSVVSLEGPGIIMALWLVAFRCRHPLLRRRALGLLRVCRRQEGVWMSTSAAAVAQRLIEVEEDAPPDSVLVPSFCTPDPITPFEQESLRQFEAEDRDPQLWLLGPMDRTPITKWDVPGMMPIPLHRRITVLDVSAQPYDPRNGRSKANATLFFAGRGMERGLSNEVISVNF